MITFGINFQFFKERWKFSYLYFDPRGGPAAAVSFVVIQVGSPTPSLSTGGPHRRARTALKIEIFDLGLTAGDN